MQTVTRYEHQDGQGASLGEGRFGRPAGDEADVTEATTPPHPEGKEPTLAVAYMVDTEAVADAIVERLLAGRTLRRPHER